MIAATDTHADSTDPLGQLEARAALYRFLSTAYRTAPTETDVAALKTEWMRLAVGWLTPTVELPADRDAADTLETIRRDHMELFRVPLARYLPPFEAVHRDERVVEGEKVGGMLMGPSTVAVKQLYAAAGADLDGAVEELPDHIGLELAFMAHLCDQERAAHEADDTEGAKLARAYQTVFVTDHLIPWVPTYCEAVDRRAESDWYRAVARVTAGLCRADQRRLGEPA